MKKKKKRREKDSRLQHEAKIGAFLSKKISQALEENFHRGGERKFRKSELVTIR